MQLFGSFEEKGYRFEAYSPTSRSDPAEFEFRILVGSDLKHTLYIPMSYVPVFGVDVGDRHRLDMVADRVLAVLPEPNYFCEETISALNRASAKFGAYSVSKRSSLSSVSADFDYTADLFAARFADVFGSRDAIDQWMKTKEPKLNDLTPEEALRVGLAKEVLQCINEVAAQRSEKASAPPSQ